MKRYKNLDGHSGILEYESGDSFIIIKFIDGERYLYNYDAPGQLHVERMKQLALRGRGLATYVNKNVRDNYAAKL